MRLLLASRSIVMASIAIGAVASTWTGCGSDTSFESTGGGGHAAGSGGTNQGGDRTSTGGGTDQGGATSTGGGNAERRRQRNGRRE